jgi:hypothetical protein
VKVQNKAYIRQYPEHQPSAMLMHDAPPKKVIAKLRGQVQTLQSQINEINSTLNELDP